MPGDSKFVKPCQRSLDLISPATPPFRIMFNLVPEKRCRETVLESDFWGEHAAHTAPMLNCAHQIGHEDSMLALKPLLSLVLLKDLVPSSLFLNSWCLLSPCYASSLCPSSPVNLVRSLQLSRSAYRTAASETFISVEANRKP